MMGADEKFVREHWVGQDPIEALVIDDPMPEFCSASVRIRGFGPCFYRSTLEEAWASAAEYTRNRLEEIRQVLRDIQFIQEYLDQSCDSSWRPIAAQSILARLQAALAELKKGMKS